MMMTMVVVGWLGGGSNEERRRLRARLNIKHYFIMPKRGMLRIGEDLDIFEILSVICDGIILTYECLVVRDIITTITVITQIKYLGFGNFLLLLETAHDLL